MRALAASVAVVAFGCADGEPRKDPDVDRSLRVTTFNVLCSICVTAEHDDWATRLGYFPDVFARAASDLVALQELLPPLPASNDIETFRDLLPEHDSISFETEDDLRGSYPDAATFYRRSRFDLVERSEYWLSPTPEVPKSRGFSPTQGVPRLVVTALLHDRLLDREIFVATTHFDNNTPGQERSAELVVERTAPWLETQPVIVTGDFNSQPSDPAFATLTDGGLADTQPLADSFRVEANDGAALDYDLAARIDHVFVGGAEWRVTEWVADLHTYGDLDRYPSDHVPITVELELP